MKPIKAVFQILMAVSSLITTSAMATEGKVLVIVSSEQTLQLKNGKTYQTGYYLNELGVPAMALSKAGYTLVFADPKGNTPAMDVTSDNAKYFGGDVIAQETIRQFVANLENLQHPLSLASVLAGGLDQYDAVFFPGGHAPMVDLMASREAGEILKYFHANGKPTALICHGPVSLLSAVSDPVAYQRAMIEGNVSASQALAKDWIYAGYNMTVFSTPEEIQAEAKLGGPTLFFPQDALSLARANVTVAPPWQSHVLIDRELITGQNPFSDEELAKSLIAILAQTAKSL